MGKKDSIKQQAHDQQSGICMLCNKPLPKDLMGSDIHRPKTRLENGTYAEDNRIVIHDSCHMKHHGIYRLREDPLEALKSLLDDRKTATKLTVILGNQLKALCRRSVDYQNPYVEEYLTALLKATKGPSDESIQGPEERIKNLDKEIVRQVKMMDDPLIEKLQEIMAVGPITASMMRVYIDLNRSPNPSSLISYVGYDVPAHIRKSKTDPRTKAWHDAQMNRRQVRWNDKKQREIFYGKDCEKVPTGYGGNQTLRTQLYVLVTQGFLMQAYKPINKRLREVYAGSLEGMTKEEATEWLKNNVTDHERGVLAKEFGHHYAAIFFNYKHRLSISEKITETGTSGRSKRVQKAWKDVEKGHRHSAAIRETAKQFLYDYWHVGRAVMGLPGRKPYVEEKLGHTGIVLPVERGWSCPCRECGELRKRKVG